MKYKNKSEFEFKKYNGLDFEIKFSHRVMF